MHFDFEKDTKSREWPVWRHFLRDDLELHPHVVTTVADNEHLYLWRVGSLGRLARLTVRGKRHRPDTIALPLAVMRQIVLKAPNGPSTVYVSTVHDEISRVTARSRARGSEYLPCPVVPANTPTLGAVVASSRLTAEIYDAVRFACRGREADPEYQPREHVATSRDCAHFFRETAIVGGTDGAQAYVQVLSPESMAALEPLLATGALCGIPASLLPIFDHASALGVRRGPARRPHVAVRVTGGKNHEIEDWYVETAPALTHSPSIPQALPTYGGLNTARMCSDPEYFAAHHRVRGDDEDLCVVQVLASDLWRAAEAPDVVEHRLGEEEPTPAVVLERGNLARGMSDGLWIGGRAVPYVGPPDAWPAHRRVFMDPVRLRWAVDALRDQHRTQPEDWPIYITHQGRYSPLMLETDPVHVRGVERGQRRVAVMPLRQGHWK